MFHCRTSQVTSRKYLDIWNVNKENNTKANILCRNNILKMYIILHFMLPPFPTSGPAEPAVWAAAAASDGTTPQLMLSG